MASDLKTSHHPFALKIAYVAMGVVFLIGLFSSFSDSLFPASLNSLAVLTSAHLHEAIAVLLLSGMAWSLTERRATQNRPRRAILMLSALTAALCLAFVIAELVRPNTTGLRTPLTILGYTFGVLLVIAFATQENT